MRYRTLGSTGIEVSTYCLGAMMFGGWGNPDHDEGVRIIHAALDAGINFVDTADVYSQGESEEIVGKALKGRRDEVVLATKVHAPMGEDPNRSGNSRRWIIAEVEQSLRRLGTDRIDLYQIHRPGPDDRHRGDAVGALGPRPPGQGARDRVLDVPRRAHRRGAVGRRAARSRALPLRAAAVLDLRPRHRGRRAARPAQRYGMGVIAWSPLAGGWLSGPLPARPEIDMTSGRASRHPRPLRPGAAGEPAQARRSSTSSTRSPRTPAISLTHLAMAFVVAHPAVTSAIIGPRTMEQLEDLLAGASVDARRRHARPHRRDRRARLDHQRRRRRLAAGVADQRLAPAPPRRAPRRGLAQLGGRRPAGRAGRDSTASAPLRSHRRGPVAGAASPSPVAEGTRPRP